VTCSADNDHQFIEVTARMITDPWFYALAVPAVLVLGLAKSGFLSGFGSLVTPLLALVMPVPQAAAIVLPLLAVMDALGLQRLWRERDVALLKLLMPAGLVGIGVGWLLFGLLSATAVATMVGALTLLFLVHRLAVAGWRRRQAPPPRPPSRVMGHVMGAASGFTSFIVHAGGPPMSAYVLPLKLDPVRVAATMAVFFAGLNLAKWIPYALLGLLDTRNLLTSLVLMPLAPLGVWAGVWALRRIDARWFYGLAYAGMALTGVKLLWDGLS
jgi:uncharacterized membrane protein YfcA